MHSRNAQQECTAGIRADIGDDHAAQLRSDNKSRFGLYRLRCVLLRQVYPMRVIAAAEASKLGPSAPNVHRDTETILQVEGDTRVRATLARSAHAAICFRVRFASVVHRESNHQRYVVP